MPTARVGMLSLGLAIGFLIGGCSRSAGDTDPRPATTPGVAVIERVIDGDTILVEVGGRRERVRLIGVDTPESVAEDRPVQCYGKEASAFTSRLLPDGTEVRLERDVEPRDQYGRLLAYVYRSEDALFVNEALVVEGYADVVTYPPNVTFAERFRTLGATARQAGRGLWSACGGPDEPAE